MGIAPFKVEEEALDGGVHAFAISGELDQATAGELRNPLMKAVDAGASAVMLDLTNCGFIDSTGLGVIVEAWKLLQQRNGDRAALTICCPAPEVKRLLEVTGLDQAIRITKTREEALEPLLS
jgi:anti-sigma B factor antagonist